MLLKDLLDSHSFHFGDSVTVTIGSESFKRGIKSLRDLYGNYVVVDFHVAAYTHEIISVVLVN